MDEMIDSTTDKKNIGLLVSLSRLRQALDVYCLIAANANAIEKRGQGKKFFHFVRGACLHLIALDICKVFEDEKKQGKIKYPLNSIDGVLMSLYADEPPVLDSAAVCSFLGKYGDAQRENETPVTALSRTVKCFKTQYDEKLKSFQTFRDKSCAHSESGFAPCALPSYDVMERLFNFAADFYTLVCGAFVSVGPCNLNRNRDVKAGLKRVLLEHGLEDVRTEMK